MAGNTRGLLKEHFEGVHRNFEWQKKHLSIALVLIKENHPQLKEGIVKLAGMIETLDKLTQNIYAKI